MNQTVKLILSYNMKAGLEESCQRFVVNRLGALLNDYDFRFTDAWYTAWGEAPQMMGGGLLSDIEKACDLLASVQWQELMVEFNKVAENITVRVVEPTGSFQI